jgi:hypothetical protein
MVPKMMKRLERWSSDKKKTGEFLVTSLGTMGKVTFPPEN